ncbi:NAD-dependent dehydratase [Hydrogenovibrio sp. SC-1]|uniref:NAD(P)H-binding protein n=1 Tax=Hydrogenovibrio sp. SC-1 TaxID=2065820 RepID=UPI000C7B99D8|nr:NAD(P)H-binding protein [Hydrogenovibrio sp. SC-1]PLA74020.1 NAD-dependent dehydratase [Hydrogenovibrio sp. SC-1]
MMNNKAVILGGTGFIGRAVVNELSKHGYEVSVVVRRPERFRDYLLFPKTKLVQMDDLLSSETLGKVFKNVGLVVNCLADLTLKTEAVDESDYVAVHQQIKKAAETAHVKRVISLSQIGADAGDATNQWGYHLGEADAIMHTIATAQTTILRAGVLLGANDEVVSCFKRQLELMPVLPVANSAKQVQPLAIQDFAKAVVACIDNVDAFGKKISVVGEERMTLKELANRVKEMMEKEDAIVFPMCRLNAKFMSFLGALAPIKSVSSVQMSLLQTDLISDTDFSSQFGFEPMSVEQALALYVLTTHQRERYNQFRQAAGRNLEELA